MSLPPPPIQAWPDVPPVWKRWFLSLFGRVGGSTGRLVVIDDDGSTVSGLDEIEERIASIPERPDIAGLEARVAALEEQIASLTAPRLGDLESRVEDLERARASDTSGQRDEDDSKDLTT